MPKTLGELKQQRTPALGLVCACYMTEQLEPPGEAADGGGGGMTILARKPFSFSYTVPVSCVRVRVKRVNVTRARGVKTGMVQQGSRGGSGDGGGGGKKA